MEPQRKYKMSEAEKERNRIVQDRVVYATRFLHIPTLEKLGMLENMQYFLANVGLGDFLQRSAPTYPELSRQFISTFTMEKEDHVCIGVTFKFNKVKYTLDYHELQEAFGVTLNPSVNWWDPVPAPDLCEFWQTATGSELHAGGEYSN